MDKIDKILNCCILKKDLDTISRLEDNLDGLLSLSDITIDYEIIMEYIFRVKKLSLIREDFEIDFSLELLKENLNQELSQKIFKYKTYRKSISIFGLVAKEDSIVERDAVCATIAQKVVNTYNRILGAEETSPLEAYQLLDLLENDMKLEMFQNLMADLSSDYNNNKGIDDIVEKGLTGLNKIKEIKEEQIIEATSLEFLRKNTTSLEILGDIGIEGIGLSIYNSDIVTIIGDEGVGKTNFIHNLNTHMLERGKNILFFVGESTKYKSAKMPLANYINRHYHKKFDWKDLCSSDLSKDNKDFISLMEAEYSRLPGKLYIKKFVKLDTFEKEVSEEIQRHNIDLVVIDHVGLVIRRKGETISESISELYKTEIKLKENDKSDRHVAFINLSHTGTEASRGKDNFTRIGAESSSTTKDADTVLYLKTNEELRLRGVIKLEMKKLREWEGVQKEYTIKQGFGSTFEVVEDSDYEIESILGKR